MALSAAFLMLCAGLSGLSSQALAQSCVDPAHVTKQVRFSGDQFPPFRLECPLNTSVAPTWFKDCVQLDSANTEFLTLNVEDQGNYTCVKADNNSVSFTLRLTVNERNCSKKPEFVPDGGQMTLHRNVGAKVEMNCTALLFWHPKDPHCDTAMHWSRNGQNISHHPLLRVSTWAVGEGRLMVSSQLETTLEDQDDFGLYTCTVRNASMEFLVQLQLCEKTLQASHTAAVIGAVVVLVLLGIAALVYAKCHLNIKMWYKSVYGDYELGDGKLYDAYISYVNNDHDRKFVNFILKPHLENKNGYKVHLNDNDPMPGLEPSAELIMNMSRSRRLIVVLSYAYLEQDWCNNNFRQGFQHLLELCPRPILILLDGQSKGFRPDVKQQLTENHHCLHILTWRHNSVTPSSVFWKELSLAMPRRLHFRTESSRDPQTLLHDDKDPMLTVDPDYLDCRSDTDPAGDLGVRLPVYKAMVCRAPVLPVAPVSEPTAAQSDVDVSDLGSRNYGARSDFYCLVTENDL